MSDILLGEAVANLPLKCSADWLRESKRGSFLPSTRLIALSLMKK
jgi:hypothetical protein